MALTVSPLTELNARLAASGAAAWRLEVGDKFPKRCADQTLPRGVSDHLSVVPPHHAEALAAGWRGPHQLVRSPQTGHADVLADAEVWAAMRRWLGRAGH